MNSFHARLVLMPRQARKPGLTLSQSQEPGFLKTGSLRSAAKNCTAVAPACGLENCNAVAPACGLATRKLSWNPTLACLFSVLLTGSICPATADAQNSSLLHQVLPAAVMLHSPGASADNMTPVPPNPRQYRQSDEQTRPPVQLSNVSWTYQPPPPVRVFRKNDVITIRVDEVSRMLAQGGAQSRKITLYEAILTDWLRIRDFRLEPDPQPNGDPTAAAESNSQFRAQSKLQSRESLTFNIAATVVDVRPNGNLVVEARKTIQVNDNIWETSLSGICRVQDIGPDNVIFSKDVIDMEVRKLDRGHLRDKYKRGWLSRWLDRVRPF